MSDLSRCTRLDADRDLITYPHILTSSSRAAAACSDLCGLCCAVCVLVHGEGLVSTCHTALSWSSTCSKAACKGRTARCIASHELTLSSRVPILSSPQHMQSEQSHNRRLHTGVARGHGLGRPQHLDCAADRQAQQLAGAHLGPTGRFAYDCRPWPRHKAVTLVSPAQPHRCDRVPATNMVHKEMSCCCWFIQLLTYCHPTSMDSQWSAAGRGSRAAAASQHGTAHRVTRWMPLHHGPCPEGALCLRMLLLVSGRVRFSQNRCFM